MNSANNKLFVVAGSTCIGKTAISISLAKHLNCEIISSDSRQFFRDLKIGTAPPSAQQLHEVKHHFVGFLSLEDYYSANMFEQDVLKLLPELFAKNGVALMTGGSGLYIDAVCNGIDDIPDVDPVIRKKYAGMFAEEGIESLRMALKIMDPVHYRQVDLKNPKRIIRALEICETTGKPYSSFLTGEKKKRDFQIIKIGLMRPREELYSRIDRRVDIMIAEGLENEARSLYGKRHCNALDTVGYKEFFNCFDGSISREQAIELIKRNTRRYAKRQMTWWKRDKSIKWFDANDIDPIIRYCDTF